VLLKNPDRITQEDERLVLIPEGEKTACKTDKKRTFAMGSSGATKKKRALCGNETKKIRRKWSNHCKKEPTRIKDAENKYRAEDDGRVCKIQRRRPQ